ncbi:MAG: hypothetical protein PVG32_13000 [Anaerolineales bacterium]|jgi:UDP-2,3-diacylglucosamine pyrophosphatase LpxH
MSTSTRLTEVLKSALEIPFDDTSKYILFSDCHRGDNSWADDFAHNQSLFFHALTYYLEQGFTYIEVGDGDELFENREFKHIRYAHSHIFWLLRQFHLKNRLYMLYGNHDIERKSQDIVADTLYEYYDQRSGRYEPLLDGIQIHEGLLLRHVDTDDKIFIVHGHQGDLMNDTLWWLGRFFVRHLWRHLQILGVRDPTSPAKNFSKRGKVENEIIAWVEENHQFIICGHTHHSMFPKIGQSLYFNTGSCVHPRCITGIEIENGQIALIKWWFAPNENGYLTIKKEYIPGAGPEKLINFFQRI